MNLPKHYSLVKEHDDKFEIHDSRDGSRFHIAKKKLHPAHQIKVMKMQKLAEGGDVDDVDTGGEDGVDEGVKLQAPEALRMDTPPQEETPTEITEGQPQTATQAPVGQPAAVATADAQSTAPVGASNYPSSQEVNKNIQGQQAAVLQESTATQKQNDAMVAQYQKNLAAEQKFMDDHAEKLNQYQQQYDKIAADVASSKIDPQRYMHSKSTGSKIGIAIGMILSGIGSGLTGQPNMAMQVLNKHIEEDIEAQKANLGTKQSLLSHNIQAQGNFLAGMNATRVQMSAIAQGKLLQVAAQTGNPIVAARAQAQALAIAQSTIPLRQQVANNEIQMSIRKDVMQRLKSQGQPGSMPLDMQDLARAGLVSPATAEKEGAAISKRQQAEAEIKDAATNLWKEQENFSGISENYLPNILNPQATTREDMLKSKVIQSIQSSAPSKRLNPEALAVEIDPFIRNVYRTGKTREEGLNGLLSVIRAHADPTPMAKYYKIPGAIGEENTVPKKFNMGPVK